METNALGIPRDDNPSAVQSDTVTGPCTTTPDDALVEAGLAVYREQYCGICHVLDTADTAGAFGPTHNGMCTIAAQRIRDPSLTGSASSAAEYILASIVDPLAYIVPGYEHTRFPMPAYTNLSEGEVNALVVMLMQEQ
jgi:mono/diheme cytochrome c family protein